MTVPEALALALQHHQAGRLAEAEAIYRQILAADPRHTETLHLLGVIAHQVGRNDVAVEMILKAIALTPNAPAFHSNLGEAYRTLGRLDEAVAAYRRAIQLKPDYAQAHNNLGNALADQGHLDEGMAAHRRALQLKPDYAEAHYNLGNALKERDHRDEAIAAYRRAIHLKPDYPEAHSNLGVALMESGQFTEAVAAQKRAVALDVNLPLLLSRLILTLLRHHGDVLAELRDAYAQWEQRHGAPLGKGIAPHGNSIDPGRRLKVGYVSPDFTGHVPSRFLTPLLEAHDHGQFEIYCYASVPRPDQVTERLKKTADVWRDVLGLTDEELAARIREDGIDILVDLTMHCGGNRLLTFARKPAPVQVTWLGFPEGTGLRAIDYRFTDARMEPVGCEWSESVEEAVRLPDSWFCYDPLVELPPPGELPALKAGHVTFGSLNYFPKTNDEVLRCWAGVLSAVEGSKLLMRCPEGAARNRVRRIFASHGIGEERIELVARVPSDAEFLKLYGRIDIGLDPFPCTGGITTCEALWMGVPVVTLIGRLPGARQTFSILSTVGLPELAANSEEEYVEIVRTLASDLPRLAQFRSTLRERMKSSPFMDAPRFARNVEHAYREMWRAWCAKPCSNPPS